MLKFTTYFVIRLSSIMDWFWYVMALLSNTISSIDHKLNPSSTYQIPLSGISTYINRYQVYKQFMCVWYSTILTCFFGNLQFCSPHVKLFFMLQTSPKMNVSLQKLIDCLWISHIKGITAQSQWHSKESRIFVWDVKNFSLSNALH